MRWSELGRAEKYNSLQVTSAEMGYPDFAVEKDWWVIEILRVISSMPVSKNMVFKGGTSLSKAWGIINRFSEDIDLPSTVSSLVSKEISHVHKWESFEILRATTSQESSYRICRSH